MGMRRLLSIIAITTVLTAFGFAQDEKEKKENVLGEVSVGITKPNSDPGYQAIRKASEDTSAFGGPYAKVNNFVLKKDRASFTLRSGEIYFLKEAQGKRTGAVFIGDGELSVAPPTAIEQETLKYFTGETEVKEPFSELVVFFTDETFDDVKNSANVQMSTGGSQAGKARDMFRGKESLLRGRFRYNMASRILMDAYAPPRRGFFRAFVNGKNHSELFFSFDPLGVDGVAPEQVSLSDYGTNSWGTWLAFHSQEDYAKGTATSEQDRRVFDITNHDIQVTIRGTRMIATDEVTMKLRAKGQRVLPFNLAPTMRVKSILDQDGQAVDFIQEDEKKDGSLSVILPKSHEVGKTFKLTFTYDGDKSLYEVGKGNFILVSRTNWYPNNGDSSGFLDRASFDMKFRYPKQFVFVGVGELIEKKEDEDDLTFAHWSTKGVEMATAGFNYGDFNQTEIVDSVTNYQLAVYNNKTLPAQIQSLINSIENYNSRAVRYDREQFQSNIGSINTGSMAKTVLDEATSSVRLYDRYFGKLPHKRIAMTQQPAGNFGQAWATLIYMPYIAYFSDTHKKELFEVYAKLNSADGQGQGLSAANNNFWREVGPHEVAHQWWGHAVGWTSYRDQWMSEGFSEFSASLFVQFVYKDTDRFIKYWDDQRDLIINGTRGTKGVAPYKIGPIIRGNRLSSSKAPGGRRVMYPKGAYVLHMLRMLMIDPKAQGLNKDARFQAMMKDFIKKHYNKDVSTEDFKRAVEKHITPEMDLYKNGKMDWFFYQWVYGTDIPAYEFEYKLSKANGKTTLDASVTQSDVSDNFVTPVPIYVDYGKGWVELGKTVMVGNKTNELKNIPLPAKPKKVAILALNDVLATKIKNKQLK